MLALGDPVGDVVCFLFADTLAYDVHCQSSTACVVSGNVCQRSRDSPEQEFDHFLISCHLPGLQSTHTLVQARL